MLKGFGRNDPPTTRWIRLIWCSRATPQVQIVQPNSRFHPHPPSCSPLFQYGRDAGFFNSNSEMGKSPECGNSGAARREPLGEVTESGPLGDFPPRGERNASCSGGFAYFLSGGLFKVRR